MTRAPLSQRVQSVSRALLSATLWKNLRSQQKRSRAEFESEYLDEIAKLAHRAALAPALPISPLVPKSHAAIARRLKNRSAWKRPAGRRKSATVPSLPHILPPSWLDQRANTLFFHFGNYAFGSPNPQVYDQTPNNYYTGLGSTTVAEYADPLTGLISVGFAGGDFRNGAGGIFSRSPITETFGGLFDGIAASASVYQLADLSALPSRSRVSVFAGLQCPVRHSDPNAPDKSFEGLFELFPGLPTSALSGFVCAYGYFNLRVTATKGSQVVASNSNTSVLFSLAYNNAQSGPGSYGSAFQTLWDDCVFIAPQTVNETIELETPLLIRFGDRLICQAEVRIVGLRGGIADPGAGYLGAKFQNDYNPVTPVNLGLLGYRCPFRVVYIGATYN